jgi:hypothetical protein
LSHWLPGLPGRARSLALFRLYFSSRPAAMRSPITGPPVKGARPHPSIQLPGLPGRARVHPTNKRNTATGFADEAGPGCRSVF